VNNDKGTPSLEAVPFLLHPKTPGARKDYVMIKCINHMMQQVKNCLGEGFCFGTWMKCTNFSSESALRLSGITRAAM